MELETLGCLTYQDEIDWDQLDLIGPWESRTRGRKGLWLYLTFKSNASVQKMK